MWHMKIAFLFLFSLFFAKKKMPRFVFVHQIGLRIRQKLSHNEFGKDNRWIYWKEEIEGAWIIQAHWRRIHPRTPAESHYEDFNFSQLQTGLKHMLMEPWGRAMQVLVIHSTALWLYSLSHYANCVFHQSQAAFRLESGGKKQDISKIFTIKLFGA